MFVEIHMLQNFAPSNLNRDDTGAPKDCEFGGYRRARISSQALKRAVRHEFDRQALLSAEHLALRTKRLRQRLVSRLVDAGRDEEEAGTVVDALINALNLRYESNTDLTQYLLFLGTAEIDALAEASQEHWDNLLENDIDAATRNALRNLLDGGRAADLALFGRMIADLPNRRIDAASQVAHAISTNRVSMEFDFYTAVDDLRPEDTEGAGMLGTVEFNSACFYRYANVDTGQLVENLGGDVGLARTTVEAYVNALKYAIPTGKQNSMAAQNPPSFFLVVVRDAGLWSLANAFLDPVRADGRGDLVANSQAALDRYWAGLASVYGGQGIQSISWVALDDHGVDALQPHKADTFSQMVEQSLAAAFPQNAGAEVT